MKENQHSKSSGNIIMINENMSMHETAIDNDFVVTTILHLGSMINFNDRIEDEGVIDDVLDILKTDMASANPYAIHKKFPFLKNIDDADEAIEEFISRNVFGFLIFAQTPSIDNPSFDEYGKVKTYHVNNSYLHVNCFYGETYQIAFNDAKQWAAWKRQSLKKEMEEKFKNK